ncbi:hypothetical protein AKJ38_02935 [candidate division MSBL1 archaeon SCGC-AAA259I14]|uniref:HhH-GPD domain-containing protein n=1 Tax=candidate division MSBL1 archaeon SCGC-AAA259I14 TaxID=1698268 RepID=A0A133UR67_9EURY|nr:hypothetical protein AKJ38_02935 [candidate division MSBL1 archaeon SCGC-AAA259I14]
MPKIGNIIDLLRHEYGVPEVKSRRNGVESLMRVILSQNTNDRNSERAYKNLIERFDSPAEILDAERDELADVISVSGLHNIKSERIKKCLSRIKEERGKLSLDFLGEMSLEEARKWLLDLPGIGPKSAAVVLNFQFEKAAFPVDTHVFRVSKRLGLIPEESTREKAHSLMEELVPDERMYEVHINLIKHGRRICKAPTPVCSNCFLTKVCDYFQENRGPRK